MQNYSECTTLTNGNFNLTSCDIPCSRRQQK